MNRVVLVIAVLGVLVSVSIATLRPFTVTSTSSGSFKQVQCAAPFYGAGHNLSGPDATACDDEATHRAETGGIIAGGFVLAGLILTRLTRPRY